jgi:hypothetical protein
MRVMRSERGWRRANALTAVAALSAAAMVAGCGGGNSGGGDRTTAHAPSAVVEKSVDRPSKAKPRPAHHRARAHHTSTPKPKSQNLDNAAVRKATKTFLQKLPANKRQAITGKIVKEALSLFGFNGVKTTIASGGTAVTVSIPEAQACKAGPRDPELMAQRIQKVAPVVSVVSVVVAGPETPLDTYIKANCQAAGALPGGSGSTVLKKTGEGLVSEPTDEFTVSSKRWSIDFRNDGQFLSVFVMQGDKTLPYAIGASKRGTGTKRISAGPGTYRLRIVGSSGWTVRVRDGA